VHLDDFIVKEKLTEPSWDKGTFDRDRLEAQVLKPLRQGHNAAFQRLIWESNTLSDPVRIPSVDLVIVEGISSYHPNIADYYGFKIWVETPMEIAKERGRARDGSNENAQYWDLWAANDLAYQEKFHPDQSADFIFRNG
jgi:uridine kinase